MAYRTKVADPVFLLFLYFLTSLTTWITSFANDYFYEKYDVDTNRTKQCGNTTGVAFETERDAQSAASKWLLYITLTIYIPSILVTLVAGGWSDRIKYGRRLMMVIPLMGGCWLTVVVLIVVHLKLSIGYLFLGSTPYGFTGGSTLHYLAMYSYVSDVSSPETRTRRLGILSAMMAVGAGAGRVGGGLLLQHVGSSALLISSLFCCVVGMLYVIVLLDDSSNIDGRDVNTSEGEHELGTNLVNDGGSEDDVSGNDFDEDGALTNNYSNGGCNMESVTGPIRILKTRELTLKPRWCLCLLLVADGLTILISDGAPTIEYLYFLGTPLCWDISTIGFFFGSSYLFMIIGATVVLTVFTNFIYLRDTTIVLVGILFFVGLYVCLAFVTSTWNVFLVLAICLPSGVVAPTLTSMLSKCVVKEHQGALFSLSASVETTNSLLALVIFNPLYSATNQEDISFLPNSGAFTFLVMAFVYTIIFVVILILHCSSSWKYSFGKQIETNQSLLSNEDT